MEHGPLLSLCVFWKHGFTEKSCLSEVGWLLFCWSRNDVQFCSNRTRKLLQSNRNRQNFFCPSWILCGFVAFIHRIAVGRWWNPWSLLWESWDFCCCCCVLSPCSYGDVRSPQRHLLFCKRFCSNSSCFFKGLVLFWVFIDRVVDYWVLGICGIICYVERGVLSFLSILWRFYRLLRRRRKR